MKTIEVRCSSERRTKSDKVTKCNRFLVSMDDFSVTVVCSGCGERTVVMRGEDGQVQSALLPSRKSRLISAPKEI
jgi:hypothetical protein